MNAGGGHGHGHGGGGGHGHGGGGGGGNTVVALVSYQKIHNNKIDRISYRISSVIV